MIPNNEDIILCKSYIKRNGCCFFIQVVCYSHQWNEHCSVIINGENIE